MKSRLAVSFGEAVDRERKYPGEGASGHLGASGKEASGIRGARVPGRKVARVFLGRLTLGPGLVEVVPGRKFSQAFLGRLTLGSGPFGAIGLGRLARGTKPGPMLPTMPPFFLPRREIIPGRDRHIMVNSRPSMLFNFNVNFVTFLKLH